MTTAPATAKSAHADAPLMLGVSGLRGIVGRSLTPSVAAEYAGAFGSWLRRRLDGHLPEVILGRDGRIGGGMIAEAVSAGLRAAGCTVTDAGVVTTPTIGVLVDQAGYDAGVIITASHNPAEWNGIKLILTEGEGASAPSAAIAQEIVEAFRSGRCDWVDEPGEIGFRDEESAAGSVHATVVDQALRGLQAYAAEGLDRYTVVLDSVNCSGAEAADDLLRRILGARTVQLHGDGSGAFPHAPEPTPENLAGSGGLLDAVPGLRAHVGFAQDPDGDRLAIVDEHGRYIGEEYTLAIAAESVLSAMDERSRAVIVVNLSTSRMVEDVAAVYGAEVVRTPVGEANVVARMRELREEGRHVVLGGEGNGGVIWPEVTMVRDSLSAMALTLSLMARMDRPVSGLVELINGYGSGRGYTILKRKAPLASRELAAPAVERLAKHYGGAKGVRVDLQDGVRIDFDERFASGRAWAHVRASNTEPIMRVIVEAPGDAEAAELAHEVEGVIGGA